MKKKVLCILCLAMLTSLTVVGQTRKDVAPDSENDSIELRDWYVQGPAPGTYYTRSATPAPGSIHVNRDATISAYSPTDYVRKIFLKAHTPEDQQRIQNVRFVGWDWDPVTQTPQNTSPLYPGNNATGAGGMNWSPANAQINVTNPFDPNESSLLHFTQGDADPDKFELEKGLLLTTGPGLRAEGPNRTHHGMSDGSNNKGQHQVNSPQPIGNSFLYYAADYSSGKHKHHPGMAWNDNYSFDRDLDALTSDSITWTTCGSVLEFDFQPAIGRATFNYIFASDEYPEGVYLTNDVFGFFVSGPFETPPGDDIENTTAQWSIVNPTNSPYNRVLTEHTRLNNDSVYYRYNIARLPDGNPVGINYVNWGSIEKYWYQILPYANPYSIAWNVFYQDNPALSPPFTYTLPSQLIANPSYPLTPAEAAAWGYKQFSLPSNWYTTNPTPNSSAPADGSGHYYAVPTNPHLFRYNYQGDPTMEYDGYTVKLQAVADKLIPGKWYHLKLAVANTAQKNSYTPNVFPVSFDNDRNHGSGVFLADLDLGAVEGDLHYPYLYDSFDYLGQDEDGNYNLFSHEEDVDDHLADCDEYVMNLHFDTVASLNHAIIYISYINIPSEAVLAPDGSKLFSYSAALKMDTLQLTGLADTLRNYEFKFTTDFPGFVNGQYVGIVVSIPGGSTDTVFYGPLYRHASYAPVYIPPGPGYNGKLELNITDGSPQLYRSVNGGLSWTLASTPVNQWEIDWIGDLGFILFREPNSGYAIDTIWLRHEELIPELLRQVIVPSVEGLKTEPPAGSYYVMSRDNFVLTIEPELARANIPLTISTNRQLIPDERGLVVVKTANVNRALPDVYVVTVYSVQEPTVFDIKFNPIDAVDSSTADEVWVSDNRIHIHASKQGTATIYTLSGAVAKTIALYQGDSTVVSLPSGLYIAIFNGKNYKIAIR